MSLKLFYSQLNLHSSALHECLKRCSTVMQACLETYDDTLYCIIMGAGLQWVWRKNSFWGAWRKGSVKRETRRNPLLLKPARSLKGSVKGGSRQNPLPFRRGASLKGSVKRETRRNPLPLKPARSLKGSVNGGSR